MTYHSDHKTNLKPLNLQFRQKQRIFILNNWSEIEPWSPAVTGYSNFQWFDEKLLIMKFASMIGL